MRGECYILFMALAALLADGQTTKTRRQDSNRIIPTLPTRTLPPITRPSSITRTFPTITFTRPTRTFPTITFTRPTITFRPIKPGVCPRSIIINVFCRQNLRDACQFDFQCPGRLKCCRTICNVNACSTPVQREPRPTPLRCPNVIPLPPQICAAAIFPHCDSNRDCRGGQICCAGPCNSRICQRPVMN